MTASTTGLEKTATTLAEKAARLRSVLSEMPSVLVAFSGGVDSTLLARVAAEVLGPRALAVTGDSAALSEYERRQAAALARHIGIAHRFVATAELENPDYRRNDGRRCYHCKSELYARLSPLAAEWSAKWPGLAGPTVVVNGTITDDLGDWRPGLLAADQFGVRSPLVEAGFSKADVRALSAELGLPTADKPATPCLASRLPYGQPVSREALAMVEAAEAFLRTLGLREFRVRHHDRLARLEVPTSLFAQLAEPGLREKVVSGLRSVGYHWVSLDLEGFVSGRNNRVLPEASQATPVSSASVSSSGNPFVSAADVGLLRHPPL